MSKINYVTGDATYPQGEGVKVIAHICNDLPGKDGRGAWGAGFVLALSKRWKEPEFFYRNLTPAERFLGLTQFANIDSNTWVCNMIAQHGISDSIKTGVKDSDPFRVIVPPIRYDALKVCLQQLDGFCLVRDASIHMPRIGSGLAGGDWNIISGIIEECTTVPVTVYDLPPKQTLK